jgi:hypothetical protein
MKRKEFFNGCGACGALAFFEFLNLGNVSALKPAGMIQDNKSSPDTIPVNREQIIQLLKYIDTSLSESGKRKIFYKLGYCCLYSRGTDKWISSFKENQDEFFNRVQRDESKYWEKLEYDKEKSVITLIGRKVESCACEYSKSDMPPKSLCKYCCKSYQETLFGLLLGRKCKVRIDDSFLLGGERCSTTIFVS